MESVNFLPLGSIVVCKNSVKKIVIIARGLVVKLNNENQLFDYGGCPYPEGITGDNMLYFNADGIAKVVYEGYSDEDNNMMVENLNNWLETTDIKRCDISRLDLTKIKQGDLYE